jgi:DNA processing protein
VNIKTVSLESREYPDNLKVIHGAPKMLFVRGNILKSDHNAVAIVGTRTPTYYGLEQSEKISYDLALRGITVVSGMARGIDSAAHRGAIKAGGRTIAVLGSGHGHIYPPENRKLYEEIAKCGAVISEFPQDTLPLRANFPRRNRIISGLTKGTVVVEAPERSGALITANFALEEGREVFAVPGNITSSKSCGTNRLIKEGAKLVQNVDDILEELRHVIDTEDTDKIRDAESGKVSTLLSFEEEKAFAALDENPKSLDQISEILDLPTQKVSQLLIKLELKSFIKTLPGEHFVALHKK